jgi:hypothetical protein
VASSKSIEAGRAFVRTDADLSPLEKKLKTIEAKFQALGGKISGIGGGLAKVGAGATAIGSAALGGILALSARFAGLGDELSKAHDRTGIAASSLSELGYAAAQSGSDLATVEKSISKMQRGIIEASEGSKMIAESFGALGLSVEKLKQLSPEDQFLAVGKAIAKIQDPTERAARAMQIFGRSGTQLLPMLISDIEALRKEARDLGVVISDDDAINATNLGDAFDRVKKSLGGIATQLGASVAKPFTAIANTLATIIGRVSAWVAIHRDIVQTVAAVAAGFVVAGTIITGVGIALIGLGATIASIGTIASAVFATIGTAISILTSPITLAVVGIAAIGYIALEASGSLATLSEMFGTLGTTATTAWAGIVAAISSGDFQTAGQIAFTALEVAWLTVTNKMKEVWNQVSDFVVNVWLNVVESIVQAGASVYFGIASYFDKLSVALTDGFDTAFVYITGAIDNIQTAIAKAIIKASEFFGLFSKEQSMEIQATLDGELSGRASGRERGLGSRSGQRAADAAGRDAQRKNTAKQFADTVREDFERRRTHSSVDGSGLTDAQKRLQELQAKLAEQASEAQAKAAKAQEESGKVQQASAAQEQASMAMQSTSAGSVGTFVSGVAGNILGGGEQSKIADATKQTADNTSKLTEQMREFLREAA